MIRLVPCCGQRYLLLHFGHGSQPYIFAVGEPQSTRFDGFGVGSNEVSALFEPIFISVQVHAAEAVQFGNEVRFALFKALNLVALSFDDLHSPLEV